MARPPDGDIGLLDIISGALQDDTLDHYLIWVIVIKKT